MNYPQSPPRRSGMPGWAIGLIIAGLLLLCVGPIVAVILLYAVRRYDQNVVNAAASAASTSALDAAPQHP